MEQNGTEDDRGRVRNAECEDGLDRREEQVEWGMLVSAPAGQKIS